MSIRAVQERLSLAGFDPGSLDGVWGPRTEAALDAALKIAALAGISLSIGESLSWGGRVSAEFRAEVYALCERQELSPDYLMACMAFETGETFSPSIRNPVSSATGLIQFMEGTASVMGTTTVELSAMTAAEQLAYVEKYFSRFRKRCKTLSDTYMAILWPRAIGKHEGYVLWAAGSRQYMENSALDLNKDGVVTKQEASAKVWDKLRRGLESGRVWKRQSKS